MTVSEKSLRSVDRRLRAMAELACADDATTLLAACGLIIELRGSMGRLKLIADRLAEFTSWTDETAAPDCDRREDELCEWHNRLLSAVHQAREIATEAGNG